MPFNGWENFFDVQHNIIDCGNLIEYLVLEGNSVRYYQELYTQVIWAYLQQQGATVAFSRSLSGAGRGPDTRR